jgi:hypothetical protein
MGLTLYLVALLLQAVAVGVTSLTAMVQLAVRAVAVRQTLARQGLELLVKEMLEVQD